MSTLKNLLFFNKRGHQHNIEWNGEYWEGRILFPEVSEDLFEVEHIFAIEKLLTTGLTMSHGIPHADLPLTWGNPMGYTAKFVSSSNTIVTSSVLSSELIGARIFSDYVEGIITGISGTNVTLDTPASSTGTGTFSIAAWRSRFESLYNVIDFDEFPIISGSYTSGNSYITSNDDLSSIKPGTTISGAGIPAACKILSISGNRINVNKIFTSTGTVSRLFIYRIEDENDVSNRLYQYNLIEDSNYDSPVISNLSERFFPLTYDSGEIMSGDYRSTSDIDSSCFTINIALNSDQESLIGRVLIIEDITTSTPTTILRMEFVGEVVGEDERLNVLLGNIGQELYKEDTGILRDSDPKEPYPDYILVNNKRKELLLQASEIFPYLGSYKGLVNIITFFGYQDLRIKEYWLNIQKSSTGTNSALQQTENFLDKVKNTPHGESVLIDSLHDDENSGKFKQVEVYGPRKDGTFGIKSSLEQIFPSTAYKKTPLFGLFYDINEIVPDEEDEFGYPITKDSFLFSPEEVLIKLFALKEKLKKDYLPLSAKIIDITGEGFYFSVNKTRGWIDTLTIDEISIGTHLEIKAEPTTGYIEDLRAFQTRTNESLPQLPYVLGYDDNTEPSNFGNTFDVTPYSQQYTPEEAENLSDAIIKYHANLINNDSNLHLGDGDYNGPGYVRYQDSRTYYIPGGFPSVLETTSFKLTMDEIGSTWENLDKNIATYETTLAGVNLDAPDLVGIIPDLTITQSIKVDSDFLTSIILTLPPGLTVSSPSGAKFQLKIFIDDNTYLVTELQSYDEITGYTEVWVLYYKGKGTYDTTWNVTTTNLFSSRIDMSYYNYTQGSDGFYSWDNLRFLGYYEIEWTITKDGENPYFYQFRGNIKDYWRIPHIFPYIGNYTVKCRVWNSFNDISVGYFNKFITVEPRAIELTSVTRFREAESYTWDQMTKSWNDYDSQWIFPLEQQHNQIHPSSRIISYSEYGNQFNDGQECYVLSTIPETRASLEFNLAVVSHGITSISSVYGSGMGPATVTTSTPHNLNPGDLVYIIDNSVSSISGEYSVLSVTPTTFVIPIIVPAPIVTVGNYMTGPGSVQISINGREYANVNYGGSIGALAGSLYTAINGSVKDPHFIIKEYEATTVSGLPSTVSLYKIVMQSPINTGERFNGQVINVTGLGSIRLNLGDLSLPSTISPTLEGGVNQYKDYVYYTPGDDLPVPEMKNWGSKQITWDSMDDITWDQLYAQTLPMYDYHGDWNGGFDLYNVRFGDRIRVGKNNEGIIIGNETSPNYPMFLYEIANQLNSSTDPGISKFVYDVRGYSRIKGYTSNGELEISSVIAPHINYTQSSVGSGAEAATYVTMTNGSYRESLATYTNSGGSEWIQLDLNQPMEVTRVVIGCDLDAMLVSGGISGTQNKDVEYSLDGSTWTVLFNTGTFSVGIKEFDVNVRTRYLRIVGTKVVVTEFYAMVPFFADLGPMDESTETYSTPGFTPTSICKGLNGETYMAAGTSIYIFKSPTDIEEIQLDYSGIFLQVDKRNRIWYYGTGSVPLQIIDMEHPDRRIAFISEGASPSGYYRDIEIPANFVSATISVLAIDDRKGDFAIKINYGSTTSLMYYDGGIQDFFEFTTSDGLTSVNIRQMVFDYAHGDKILWIATNNGISIYDGVKFLNYQTTNSGLFSNDVYSICIDELDHKWIGTADGITYFDGETWGVWTSTNSPSLASGVSYTNIVTTGHSNIFFTIRDGIGGYKLGFFNGDTFVNYTNAPGTNTTFSPYINVTNSYENNWIFVNEIKTIDGFYTQYPGNIFYLDSSNDLNQIDFIIPHIHASSKYPGNDGWDFVYYDSTRSLPSERVDPRGLGYGIVDFNFIVGPVNGNYILTDQFRPKFASVDWYTWKKPHWVKGSDFRGILASHPNLNEDHLFLHAPLRDITNGSALKEEYWRNPPIERSASRRSRDQFSNFEWLIKLGSASDDRGMKVIVGKDGYIYVTGYFKGSVFFGSPNSTNSGVHTTISSNDCYSIFVAKYNSSGIIQWVRMYGQPSTSAPYNYDFTPTSIKLDKFGNVYVVGFKEKNRNNLSGEKPTNLLLRWDWNGTVISATELFSPSSSTAYDASFDVVVDDANNLYIAGEFSGTLTTGLFTITSATPTTKEIYVAKIENNGSIGYLKKLNTGEPEYSPRLALGKYNDLYIAYYNATLSTQKMVLASYNAITFTQTWKKEIINTDYIVTSLVPSMRLSGEGEIVIGVSFNGTLTVDGKSISCPGSLEYAILKFYTTGNLVYAKNIGSGLGNYLHDIEIDNNGRIYMIGSYTSAFSPDTYSLVPGETSIGNSDILLIKLESDSSIIDITSIGSIAQDEGLSVSLDEEENIYLTGYISGSIEEDGYVTSPGSTGNDIFIGKIPKIQFIPGKSMPGPISWMGTQSWGWSDKRIHRSEFEIPIGSTVFINPLDSNIPGKKGHKWRLIEQSTGDVVIDIKGVQYFIWTFKTAGYFNLEVEIQDTNGNVYKTTKEGYIRVVDHKAIFEGESVPHPITSKDFKQQSVYPY